MPQLTISDIYPATFGPALDRIHEEAYKGYMFRFKDMQYETLYHKFMQAAPSGSMIMIELVTPGSPFYANYGENTVVVTSDPALVVTAVVTESENNIIAGDSVTFECDGANFGSNPTYLWLVNDLPVGEDVREYTYAPVNGDVVTCRVSTSVFSATPNPVEANSITMIVNPLGD